MLGKKSVIHPILRVILRELEQTQKELNSVDVAFERGAQYDVSDKGSAKDMTVIKYCMDNINGWDRLIGQLKINILQIEKEKKSQMDRVKNLRGGF
ncbi:hypothetical protein J4471_02910 [Candidatus Woesearchaeota archaeon]|nr:hypothetical protein [Candidatus Woesearchaeota archaeon]